MSAIKLLISISRSLHLKKILLGLVLVYIVCSLLLWQLDPAIETVGNGFWFGFILITTIGFGDYTVTTMPARIVAMILGLYGDLTIIFITGIMTSWIYERWQDSKDTSITQVMYQLENLPDLSDEETDYLQKQFRPDEQR